MPTKHVIDLFQPVASAVRKVAQMALEGAELPVELWCEEDKQAYEVVVAVKVVQFTFLGCRLKRGERVAVFHLRDVGNGIQAHRCIDKDGSQGYLSADDLCEEKA